MNYGLDTIQGSDDSRWMAKSLSSIEKPDTYLTAYYHGYYEAIVGTQRDALR